MANNQLSVTGIISLFPELMHFRPVISKYIILLPMVLGAFSCTDAEELKKEQYFSEGYQLYTANCSNCHQPDGRGMANLYPPLVSSVALKNKGLLSCIIKYGMKDTILVAGKQFSRPMPANPKLTELEIAEIMTFVSVKWAKDSVYTRIGFVTGSLADCQKRQGSTNL